MQYTSTNHLYLKHISFLPPPSSFLEKNPSFVLAPYRSVIIKFNFWSSERQRCLHQFGRVVTKVNVVNVQCSKIKVKNAPR